MDCCEVPSSPVVYQKGRSKLILPDQPYHNDFLQTMSTIFSYARIFGVAGSGSFVWKIWGTFLLILLLLIEAEAIWKVIKALTGIAIDMVGNRSVTARLAGAMFYASSIITLVLSWRLSSYWRQISVFWTTIENSLTIHLPPDVGLKKEMITITVFLIVFSSLEHILSVVSTMPFGMSPEVTLKSYILTSHAFLFLRHEYTTWLAVPVLIMSKIATLLWNFQDLLIILISKGLSSRYTRLNQYVAELSRSKNNKGKNSDIYKEYTWRKVREGYVKQAVLVRKVNGLIGGMLLWSNFGNFYFVCLQLFLLITQDHTNTPLKRVYFFISLTWLCIRTSSVVITASDVHEKSRRALRYLHNCAPSDYNIEVNRLQYQLSKDFVALSGMGFFSLKRNILLQMIGAVITYELVLIQFDNKLTLDPTTGIVN